MNVSTNEVCVGCGICCTVCPQKCIEMKYNQYKEYTPIIDSEKCIRCGLCNEFCTMSHQNQEEKNKRLDSYEDKYMYGLEDSLYYIGTHTKLEVVLNSASGGFVSYLAKTLLLSGIVTAVINAKCIFAPNGFEHFSANICRTAQEVDESSGSVYGPVHFDHILESFRCKSESILVIGTPCVIWGMKKLFNELTDFKDNKIITLALSCSHNVNGQFSDCIADYYNISSEPFKVNYRTKDIRMKNQSNFYISVINENGKEVRQNRFKSIWTYIWRGYFFALKACDHCNDFWGYEADICVKDAWGIGNKFQYGSNMIIVRDKLLLNVIKEMNEYHFEEIPISKVVHAQESSVVFKQIEYLNRERNHCDDHSDIIYMSKKTYMTEGIDGILSLIKSQEIKNEKI